ncbi:hypothetical protein MPLA_140157 [Mesorhizobium sp. ORS 3359]|nr:hypothetical protein MPLA_140157 [Mesorhizobium sp. ORS 3359]
MACHPHPTEADWQLWSSDTRIADIQVGTAIARVPCQPFATDHVALDQKMARFAQDNVKRRPMTQSRARMACSAS